MAKLLPGMTKQDIRPAHMTREANLTAQYKRSLMLLPQAAFISMVGDARLHLTQIEPPPSAAELNFSTSSALDLLAIEVQFAGSQEFLSRPKARVDRGESEPQLAWSMPIR
jgi:hypothetical protein